MIWVLHCIANALAPLLAPILVDQRQLPRIVVPMLFHGFALAGVASALEGPLKAEEVAKVKKLIGLLPEIEKHLNNFPAWFLEENGHFLYWLGVVVACLGGLLAYIWNNHLKGNAGVLDEIATLRQQHVAADRKMVAMMEQGANTAEATKRIEKKADDVPKELQLLHSRISGVESAVTQTTSNVALILRHLMPNREG